MTKNELLAILAERAEHYDEASENDVDIFRRAFFSGAFTAIVAVEGLVMGLDEPATPEGE